LCFDFPAFKFCINFLFLSQNKAVFVFEMTQINKPFKLIWFMPIQNINPSPAVQKRFSIFGKNGFEVKLNATIGNGDDFVLWKSIEEAEKFKKEIEKAKSLYKHGLPDYELCDVPGNGAELPTCSACNKLFHGIKCKGYKKIGTKNIVHGECIEKIRLGDLKINDRK
jgi:hypothetical protein